MEHRAASLLIRRHRLHGLRSQEYTEPRTPRRVLETAATEVIFVFRTVKYRVVEVERDIIKGR